VAVIGAGPVGLAAAAHLHQRDLPFVVLEAADKPGAAVAEWGQVRMFSPWRYNTDQAARQLLEASGWVAPDAEELPTGAQLVEAYLVPLAALPALAPHIHYRSPVVAISRLGVDRVRTAGREQAPFVLRLADGQEVRARAVIDASGTWNTPNVLGGNGLPAHGEPELADRIDPAMPDVLGAQRHRFAGRHTVVVGGGHSAANTILALAELADTHPGTRITWAVRGEAVRAFGGGEADALPARGALGTGLRLLVDAGKLTLLSGFTVDRIREAGDGKLELSALDGRRTLADRVVGATGFRPDHSIAGELRLDLDPILGCTRALAPLIDPNEHSCGTVRPHGVDELAHPEPGYYAVGMKSYGRAPTFLTATGYEQVRSIVAALAGDWAAARQVHLDLPEPGVCSTTLGARSMMADAAARLGLARDVPNRLVAATIAALPQAGTVADAVRIAAKQLDLDEQVAMQLAALAGDQFDAVVVPAGASLISVSGGGGGCCG
jgi:thioredoxin reductase